MQDTVPSDLTFWVFKRPSLRESSRDSFNLPPTRQTSGCGELDIAGAGGGGTSIEADHAVIFDNKAKRTAACVPVRRGAVGNGWRGI